MTVPRRVLLVSSHPVQYASPIFRTLAKDPRVAIQVAYGSMEGAVAATDPDFGVQVKWDIALLDGYPWLCLQNPRGFPNLKSLLGKFNKGVWPLIRRGNFDAVVLYTGYVSVTFWLAIAAAKMSGVPVLFGTDAHDLVPRDGKRWKVSLKRWLWPRLFGLADIVLVVSSGGAELMRSLGIPEQRIVLAPFCVDNEWWTKQAALADRAAVRARWGVPENAAVILFCAKLQIWKRPRDLLLAFATLADLDAYLVFAGDGPLRAPLEMETQSLGISARVRFLGFVNQSALPEIYKAADVMVLPSSYEPFGLVVNEAMLCGRPAIVSDRVGARSDLVREGENGYVFSCGDVSALADILRRVLGDRVRLRRMGEAAWNRMATWSHRDYARALIDAVLRAIEMSDGLS